MERESGGGVGEGREEFVGDVDEEGDAGAGEGSEGVGVGGEEADGGDGVGLEEGDDGGCPSEVVGHPAVADSDRRRGCKKGNN